MLSSDELRDLDPDSGFRRGFGGILHAIRQGRQRALSELLLAAIELDALSSEAAVDRLADRLTTLEREAERQKDDPASDPFWRAARAMVVDVGAAALALVDEDLETDHGRRVVEFGVDEFATPLRLRTTPGTERWTLLTDLYARQAARGEWERRESGLVLAAMAVDAMIAIDDIDPADVYDDYYDCDSS